MILDTYCVTYIPELYIGRTENDTTTSPRRYGQQQRTMKFYLAWRYTTRQGRLEDR